MTKIQVKAQTGGEAGEIDLSDELFNAPVNEQVVRVCYNQYRANQRAGTHSAKTRGHVSGGGKKPWRQKGTGRARAGSSRSPLWRGGAVIFGPLPRDYSYRVNKKVKRSAILSLLSARRQEGALIVVDDLAFESPKTKQFVQVLQSVGAGDARRVLVVGDSTNENLRLSARNLPNVAVINANNLNVFELLTADRLVLTRAAVEAIHRIHGAGGGEATEEEDGEE
jgi:large subunit ribosomal protein L4